MAEDPTALFDPNKLNLAVQNTVANSLEKDGADTYL